MSKFIQIAIDPSTDPGYAGTVHALDSEGVVWKYDYHNAKWYALSAERDEPDTKPAAIPAQGVEELGMGWTLEFRKEVDGGVHEIKRNGGHIAMRKFRNEAFMHLNHLLDVVGVTTQVSTKHRTILSRLSGEVVVRHVLTCPECSKYVAQV